MYRVKIFGAGSIGNHMSHAARLLGWNVDVCDVDSKALRRMKEEIYPSRYGSWDTAIRMFEVKDMPQGGYDLIIVGTPPDTHIPVAMLALNERPLAILVEKPFCTPMLVDAREFYDRAQAVGVKVFVGYDHVLGHATKKIEDVMRYDNLGSPHVLDVEFREFWGGIFAAHPWLNGPKDSYLGYSMRGGGATGEHSHALNLWQHLAHRLGKGRVTEVQALMSIENDRVVDYDSVGLINLKTEFNLIGRVVQDIVTQPPRKWARLQCARGYAEWVCGYQPGVDAVLSAKNGEAPETFLFNKTRPDDFVMELRHIESEIEESPQHSPISIERGLDTMLLIAAAYKSAQEHRTIKIDYSQGYCLEALS